MNNRYPMKGMMDQAASRGRRGDSMLMHVNPIEVNGIAALSPGGLTTNPDTGLPEASNWLKTLVPMMASYAGAAALTAATGGAAAAPLVAMAGGLSSGLATGAMTGDWERGLASGVMGAGMGMAMGGIGNNLAEEGLTEAATGMAGNATPLVEGASMISDPTLVEGLMSPEGVIGMSPIMPESSGIEQLLANPNPQLVGSADAMSNIANFGGNGINLPQGDPELSKMSLQQLGEVNPNAVQGSYFGDPSVANLKANYGDALASPFQKGSGAGAEFMKPTTIMPMAIGAGQLAQMDADEENEEFLKEKQGKSDEELRDIDRRQQAAWKRAQPNMKTGISPLRGKYGMAPNPYMPPGMGMARGGIVPHYGEGGPVEAGSHITYGGKNTYRADPVTVQAGLRGEHKVKPPSWYRPGFDPEFDYFQDFDIEAGEGPTYPTPTSDQDWANMYRPFKRLGDPLEPAPNHFFTDGPTSNMGPMPPSTATNPTEPTDPTMPEPPPLVIIDPRTGQPVVRDDDWNMGPTKPPEYAGGGSVAQGQNGLGYSYGYAEGGDVMLNSQTGQPPAMVAPGGIAGVQNQYTEPPAQPAQPSQEELMMVSAAVTGEAGPQADQIIEAFIQKYGPEVFRQIREMILQSMQPNAQTEGMIQGQGGGMDDQVMGTIGGQQPIAVSPGEYIVPADVVSGLGDGSSDAGSAELDQMSDNVRMARGGSTTQPPPFNARKIMPA